MMQEIENEIKRWVITSDYLKGTNYDEEGIDYIGKTRIDKEIRHQFLVESESSYKKYMVQIEMLNNHISSTYCTCKKYQGTHSCKHLAACLISYSEKIFANKQQSVEASSSLLLSKLKTRFHFNNMRKEEVFLIPYIGFHKTRSFLYATLKVKIGMKKFYSFLGKMNSFLINFQNQDEYQFGSSFTFKPSVHFFSEENLKLLDFLKELKDDYTIEGNYANLSDKNIKKLFQLCQDKIYDEDEQNYYLIKEEFPIGIDFQKKDKKYILAFQEDLNSLKKITDDYEYVLKGQSIYHLTKEEQFLISQCCSMQLEKIVFPEEMFADYQKNLIRIIKSKIVLDESTKDVIIDLKPEAQFYFDILEDHIIATPKFTYKNKTISYFDKVDALVRDEEYENQIIEVLYKYHFHKMSSFFLLDDFDEVCDFMSGSLDELAQSYEVYTTENIKRQKFVKENKITTSFTIGKDHILKYTFDLGAISKEEIKKVLNSLEQKKKYYRLKSGEILSLEDKNLEELNSLSKDLELTSKDLMNNEGELPKFRALYLDAMKGKKYPIIKTDLAFQDFINQFKNYKDCKITFNKTQEKILRDYQKEGVQWLYTITKCGFGGILADEMGLGKSLQTIYYLQELLKENKESKFLIICPTALVYNWENEFQKFAQNLKFKVFSGNKNNRKKAIEAYKGNIYITSYGLLREDFALYQNMKFESMIIDEAQNIKNPSAGITKSVKSISSNTKIALTGTPIENSIVELWSIFDFIMPGFLSSLIKFQKKYQIKEFDEKTNRLLENLKEQVRPFILRRLKKDVIQDLPDKIENNIYIDLSEEQKTIYAAEVINVEEQVNEMIEQSGFQKNKMMILKLLTRLRQICIDPSLIIDNYKGGCAKLESLIGIIKEVSASGHKILLFTSFKTALEKVKQMLEEENISSYTIAGDVPSKKRQMLVDAFNKDNTQVFLIMLKSGGTGLNLTSADVVIHLDLWWNPQAESQATDRTHRIGQTKNVTVMKLICKGTIEERILELQEKKKVLSNKILNGEMSDADYLSALSESDIRMLLVKEKED